MKGCTKSQILFEGHKIVKPDHCTHNLGKGAGEKAINSEERVLWLEQDIRSVIVACETWQRRKWNSEAYNRALKMWRSSDQYHRRISLTSLPEGDMNAWGGDNLDIWVADWSYVTLFLPTTTAQEALKTDKI